MPDKNVEERTPPGVENTPGGSGISAGIELVDKTRISIAQHVTGKYPAQLEKLKGKAL